MLDQFPLSALGTGNPSTGAWFITLTSMGVAAAESPGWHHVPSARARAHCVHVQPEIPDINVKKETPNHPSLLGLELIRRWTLVEVGVWGRGAERLPAGVTQLVSHAANTHPLLSRRRPYQPGEANYFSSGAQQGPRSGPSALSLPQSLILGGGRLPTRWFTLT